MSVYLEIQSVHAREILDSRGNPTVEAEVFVKRAYGFVSVVLKDRFFVHRREAEINLAPM